MSKHIDSYIIRTVGLRGSWIRDNESFAKAAKLLHARGVRKTDHVILDLVINDNGAVVDDYGALSYDGSRRTNARRVEIGYFTLGHVTRSNGF
jgi:hypothetical protein